MPLILDVSRYYIDPFKSDSADNHDPHNITSCEYDSYMWTNIALQWRRNGHDGVSNHHSQQCLLSRLFGRRAKKTSKLHVTGLCAGNSPINGEFPAQMASIAENILWTKSTKIAKRVHILIVTLYALSTMIYDNLSSTISRNGVINSCAQIFINWRVLVYDRATWYMRPYIRPYRGMIIAVMC